MSAPGTLTMPDLPIPKPKLAVVLLAAGEGSRMGSIPKALLRRGDRTILESFCNEVSTLKPIEILVVTGFHAQAIEDELKRLQQKISIPLRIKRHPSPREGQSSSVRLALESLQSDYDVLAMCLSDQPNIKTNSIELLLRQFEQRNIQEHIVMPIVDGQRGNPALFSKSVIDSILQIPGMTCRAYMDLHPKLVKICASDHRPFVEDVDTLEDIVKWGMTQ